MKSKCSIELLRDISQYLSYINLVGVEQFKEKLSEELFITLSSNIAQLKEIYIWEYKIREEKKMCLAGLDHPMFIL